MPDSPAGTDLEEEHLQAPPNPDEKPASESSAEDEGATQETMLDAVSKALEPKEESPASEEPDPESAETPAEGSAEDDESDDSAESDDSFDEGELTEQERQHLSQQTQRRIKKLVAQGKEQIAKIEELQPRAEQFDRILSYVKENRLTQEDVDQTFNIAALVRNDPEKALEALMPIVQTLEAATGRTLPDDLRNEVRQGYITREKAEELSQARAARTLAETRNREADERRQKEERQRDTQTRLDNAVNAANQWHADQAAKDPDYKLKQARIAEKAELEVRRVGKILEPSEVTELLGRIKQEVDKETARFAPKPRPAAVVEGTASPGNRPKPESTLDVINQALAAG